MKSLQLHALIWGADARYWIGPGRLEVARSEVAVVVAEPAVGTALADVVVGLAEPLAGSVHVEDRDVTGLAPGRRGIALVPAGGGLLPHLTVERNIQYGLRRARAHRGRARHLAEQLQLGGVRRRHPHELSPVQRLRVAVARALCQEEEPAALVVEDRLTELSCRAAVATAVGHDVAVLVITDSAERGATLSQQLHTAKRVTATETADAAQS